MRRIGLLGGMSWESTAEYYRLVNEAVRDRLGGLHSADCLVRSVDFAGIEELQRSGRWDEAGERLAAEAAALAAGGAELLVLCTNTMHKVADAVADAAGVPFVHIADATAAAVRAAGMSTVGLLATAYTMEQDFYVGRLRERHGLEVLVPGPEDRRMVHDVIYRELCVGVISEASRADYQRIMAELAHRGAQAILLGCTEIDLLVGQEDSPVPLFDTTRLHAERAVDLALTLPAGDPRARALVAAIRSGDVAALEALLRAEPELARMQIADPACDDTRSPLHVATDWPGHFPNGPAVIAALVAAGADVDARGGGRVRETPLHWAASSDDVTALDALLDAGADIDAGGAVIAGGSPLCDAVAFGQWKAARRLVERGATVPFREAAALGLAPVVREHAEAAGPEAVSMAFWYACHGGQRETAEYLLERGAELDWVSPWDRHTPLAAARRSAAHALAEWLEARGARLRP